MHRKELFLDSTPILKQAQVTCDLTSACLTTTDLSHVTIASNKASLFKKSLDVRKAEKLLQFVLNADPTGVQSLIGSTSDSVVLQKVSGKEEYKYIDSEKKEEKLVCKRGWKSISPLEAAAWAGDNFLVEDILSHVPSDKLAVAIAQLEGMIEKKATDENGYLSPFKNLINAYQHALQQYDELITKPRLTSFSYEIASKIDQILIKEVGGAQFRLSAYGLQEFCEVSSQFPNFNRPPRRETYRFRDDPYEDQLKKDNQEEKLSNYVKESLLDLTMVGNQFFLRKSFPPLREGEGVCRSIGIWGGTPLEQIKHDSNFINKNYEKRKGGLKTIINRLKRQLLCSKLTSYCVIL